MTCGGFVLGGPAESILPVVLSVPHGGRDYADIAPLARATVEQLRRLEDPYADRLIEAAVAAGARAVVALRPRAWIDLNRADEDLDSGMVVGLSPRPLSARARGGLGLVPRRLPLVGELWRRPFDRAELAARLADRAAYWTALDTLLGAAAGLFGQAVLLDVHSMPPLPGSDPADVVVSDADGATTDPLLLAQTIATLRAHGLRVAVNEPYRGGAIVRRFGRPRDGVSALQLEFARPLYLDAMNVPHGGLARMQAVLASLVEELSAAILPLPRAAE